MLDSVFGEVSDKSSYFPCPFSEVQSKYDHFLNNTKKTIIHFVILVHTLD